MDDRDYMRKRATYDPKVFRQSKAGRASVDPASSGYGAPTGAAQRPSWLLWGLIAAVGVAVVLYERRTDQQGGMSLTPHPSVATAQEPVPSPQRSVPPPAVVIPQPAPLTPAAPPARAQAPAQNSQPQDPWASVYLCRSWQGAEFWSSTPCQQVQASIIRIHRVSSALPWTQQVAIAEQERRQAEALLRR